MRSRVELTLTPLEVFEGHRWWSASRIDRCLIAEQQGSASGAWFSLGAAEAARAALRRDVGARLMRHLAVYLRPAGEITLAAQESALQRWLTEDPHSEVKWYEDAAGIQWPGPGWRSLHKAIHAGQVETLVVTTPQVLGTCAAELCVITAELAWRRVSSVFTESGSLGAGPTPYGRLQWILATAFQAYEVELEEQIEVEIARRAVAEVERRLAGATEARLAERLAAAPLAAVVPHPVTQPSPARRSRAGGERRLTGRTSAAG